MCIIEVDRVSYCIRMQTCMLDLEVDGIVYRISMHNVFLCISFYVWSFWISLFPDMEGVWKPRSLALSSKPRTEASSPGGSAQDTSNSAILSNNYVRC